MAFDKKKLKDQIIYEIKTESVNNIFNFKSIENEVFFHVVEKQSIGK